MSIKQQKSTILTSLDINFFKLNLYFLSYFNELFSRKSIILTQYNLIKNANHFSIVLDLYFREKKLIFFRKLNLRKNKNNIAINLKTKFIDYLLKEVKNKFFINVIIFDLKILNRLVLFSFFFRYLKKKTKFFKKKLFERRYGLYLDILKISVLYYTNQVKLEHLLNLIAEIFKRLSKRKHGVFLKFIKILFKTAFLKAKKTLFRNRFKGCKFVLAGKIRGKLRSKQISLVFGSIPISTISKRIDCARVDVNTVYGVFGIKLFVYKDTAVRKNFFKIIKRFFLVKKLIQFLKKKKKLSNFKKKYSVFKKKKKNKFFKTNFRKYNKFNKTPSNYLKKKLSVSDQIKQGTFSMFNLLYLKKKK